MLTLEDAAHSLSHWYRASVRGLRALTGLALVLGGACTDDPPTAPAHEARAPSPASLRGPRLARDPGDPTFKWGVDIHPLTFRAYTTVSIGEQLDAVRDLGATYARVSVSQDYDGNDLTSRADGQTFGDVLAAADLRGIRIVPHLHNGPEIGGDGPGNYALGKLRGQEFARRYGSRLTSNGSQPGYVIASNELDGSGWALLSAGVDGRDMWAHYDQTKLALASAYLHGMSDGVHEGYPGLKVVVNGTYLHTGFFDRLQSDGVPYDVLAWHWYSDMDGPAGGPFGSTVYPTLLRYGRELWVGEFNRRPPGSEDGNEEAQARDIERLASEFYGLDGVQAAFAYELFDQPGREAGERGYGLVRCGDVDCASRGLKPAFYAYRNVIAARGPQPLQAWISGPSHLVYGAEGTWYAQPSGGTPPYTYEWRGFAYGTEQMVSVTGYWGGDLYLTVRDATGAESTTSQYVHVNDPWCGGPEVC